MRKWRRCQCTIHKCKYRAKPDSDFCDECEFNPPWCYAVAEYENNNERLPKGGVSRSRKVEELPEDVPF